LKLRSYSELAQLQFETVSSKSSGHAPPGSNIGKVPIRFRELTYDISLIEALTAFRYSRSVVAVRTRPAQSGKELGSIKAKTIDVMESTGRVLCCTIFRGGKKIARQGPRDDQVA
jgi:hypothetical protein